jgi:glycerol-3-phosphate dehydrogenase (NAD(P)+)
MKNKVAYLGAGTWGSALACLLAENGHDVKVWDRDLDLIKILDEKRKHPKLKDFEISKDIKYLSSLEDVLEDCDVIVESVTSSGIRPVFQKIKEIKKDLCPVIITSKGLEQKTGLLFPEIFLDIFSEEEKEKVGCISGPSHAEEVIKKLPTSVVCSAYNKKLMHDIALLFNSENFRVYPNADILGVSFGGALKNIIAIACGISDGLSFGDNTKAALMTRGLHEMRKLSPSKGCNPQTLNGLSGLGDLCVTCLSSLSRNYRFGRLIAEGFSLEDAKIKIGMVVEGAYTCVSARELGMKYDVALPITEAIYRILYEGLSPHEAVKALFQRAIKEEHL